MSLVVKMLLKKISPKILILEARTGAIQTLVGKKILKKYEMERKKLKIECCLKKINKKISPKILILEASGPVPFGSAWTNSGGFGALSLQTWEISISENIDPRANKKNPKIKLKIDREISPKILTGAIRRGLGEKISPKILILEHKKN